MTSSKAPPSHYSPGVDRAIIAAMATEGVRTIQGALAELVTNSDDAFDRAKKPVANPEVTAKIDSTDDSVELWDNAGGFGTYKDFVDKTKERGTDSHTATSTARGLFGLGMLDVIYGNDDNQRTGIIAWMSSKDPETGKAYPSVQKICMKCAYYNAGDKDGNGKVMKGGEMKLERDDNAFPKNILTEDGTYVKFYFNQAKKKLPETLDDLVKKTENHYEFKNILASDKKLKLTVIFKDTNNNTTKHDSFTPFYESVKKEVVKLDIPKDKRTIEIDGFKIPIISWEAYKVLSPLEVTGSNPENRTGGFYIEDEEKRILDLSMLGREHRPMAKNVIGKIVLGKKIRKYIKDQLRSLAKGGGVKGKTVITKERTGLNRNHDFYDKMRKAVGRSIDQLLKDLAKRSGIDEGNEFGEFEKDLNELAKEAAMESGEVDGDDKKHPKPKFMAFESDKITIIKDRRKGVKLWINTNTIPDGTTIKFTIAKSKTSSYKIVNVDKNSSLKVRKSEKEFAAVLVKIDASTDDDKGTKLTAVASLTGASKSTKIPPAECTLYCSPTPDDFFPQDPIEFSPKHANSKPDVESAITLWVDRQLLTKTKSKKRKKKKKEEEIRFEFTPSKTSITKPEDEIELIGLGKHTKTKDNKLKYSVTAEKIKKAKKVTGKIGKKKKTYAKFTFKFKGSAIKFKGKLEAKFKRRSAECTITIGGKGGLVKDWKAVSGEDFPYGEGVPYNFEPDDGTFYLNLDVKLVSTMLGENNNIAQSRFRKNNDVKMWVIEKLIDELLNIFLTRSYQNQHRTFTVQSDDWEIKFAELRRVMKTDFIAKNELKFLLKFKSIARLEDSASVNADINVKGGKKIVTVISLDNEPVDRQFDNHEHKDWQKKNGKYSDYDVELSIGKKFYNFTVGVWEDTKGKQVSVCTLNVATGDSIYETLSKLVRKFWNLQSAKQSKGSALPDNCVFAAVRIPVRKKKISIDGDPTQLSDSDMDKIPDEPKIDKGKIVETSPAWAEHEVLLAMRKEFSTSGQDEVCIGISHDNIPWIVMSFLRCKIIPLLPIS